MAPRARQLFSRIGAGCLLAIIPIKAIRVAGVTNSLAVGVAPSLLGPAGLLFFLLSTSGRLSKLSLFQQTCLVGILAVVLEVLQLCPRPGVLRYVRYTFDYFDIVASIVSVGVAYLIALAIMKRMRQKGPVG